MAWPVSQDYAYYRPAIGPGGWRVSPQASSTGPAGSQLDHRIGAQGFNGAAESKTTPAASSPKHRLKKLVEAVGLLGVGMLLHRLPARVPKDGFKTVLPTDWKVWARVLLGIDAVHKLNQAFEWRLPPWLGALEAVAVINPMAVGFSAKGLKQTAVMAPVVAGVVQGASLLHQKIAKPVQEQCQVSPLISQIGITLGLGLMSMLAYPKLYKLIASTGIIGKELKQEAAENASAFASATFASCARGCSPGSFICLSELADIVGSFGHWFRSRKHSEDSDGGKANAASAPTGHCGSDRMAGRLA